MRVRGFQDYRQNNQLILWGGIMLSAFVLTASFPPSRVLSGSPDSVGHGPAAACLAVRADSCARQCLAANLVLSTSGRPPGGGLWGGPYFCLR